MAPTVSTTVPANGATNVTPSQSITVTFSEPVNVTGDWFTLVCTTSGSHAGTVSGGPTTFTIDPTSDFVGGENCTLTIVAANVTDQDTNDPPDNMVLDFTVGFTAFDVCAQPYTSIPAIQGSGATAATTGTVTTKGVVVGDYEGASPALRGFFIQDPAGDGNPATSDGIFVFEGSNANTVSLGDLVRVTGTAGENQGQSQVSVGTIVKCGTGTVTPTDVTFPVASADFLEQYEGMLVRLPQTMYVTEHFQLGRFGQVVLSSGGRLEQPTNVVAPGVPANALQAQNNLNKIILDDASQAQNPDPILFARGGQPLSASNTLRGGDTATDIVGVMTYTWAGNSASGNAYRIRPINALNGSVNFEPTNPRPTAVPDVGGTVKAVGMNLLNFFNTFDGLPDNVDNCSLGAGGRDHRLPRRRHPGGVRPPVAQDRGRDHGARRRRRRVQRDRERRLRARQRHRVPRRQAQRGDGARHLRLHRRRCGHRPGQCARHRRDQGGDDLQAGSGDPRGPDGRAQHGRLRQRRRLRTAGAARRSLQAFEVNATGARFLVNGNHLKSKGSACDAPDAGDGQGNCNQVRVNAASELLAWFATDPTGTGDPDVLMLGDYNSYAKEDPITTLLSGGFTNLIDSFIGPDAYSYVFDGQWGYLDHALGSATLIAQVTGVADYHINADEPSVLDYNTDFKTAEPDQHALRTRPVPHLGPRPGDRRAQPERGADRGRGWPVLGERGRLGHPHRKWV